MDVLREYWWLILVVAGLAILAFVILRPRQRVQLTDSAPVRPHMVQAMPSEGRGLAGEMAAAAADVSGEILGSRVHGALEHGGEAADDFLQLKGVGPKLASVLNDRGIWRYEQLAALDRDAAQRLDDQLGPFRGRLARDRVIEQARFLAIGDRAGFEAQFGKL